MTWTELRAEYVRLSKAHKSWISEAGLPPAMIREFRVPVGYDNMNFVFGGQWAISVNPSGKVIYFDLHADKKQVQAKVLIESQSNGRSQFKFTIDQEAGHAPHKPGFNIAFSFTDKRPADPTNAPDLHEMRIWHVKPDTQEKPDGSYPVCGLTANLVSSFRHHPEVLEVTSLSLYISKVAFSALYTNINKYTVMVDWQNEAERKDKEGKRLCSWIVLEHNSSREDSMASFRSACTQFSHY